MPEPRDMTPEQARRAIVTTLKPGREYTYGDIATICGLRPKAAMGAARALGRMGLLEVAKLPNDGGHVYRLRVEQKDADNS